MDSTGAEQQAGRVVLQPHFKENEKKNNEGTMYSGNHRGFFFFFQKELIWGENIKNYITEGILCGGFVRGT